MPAKDIGIDLGTRNSLVFSTGRGIVLREPSVVIYDKDTEKIRAIGEEARQMASHLTSNMEVIWPIRGGVIVDYNVMEKMLKYFISQAMGRRAFRKPRVSISVPSGITEIERKAMEEAAYQSGAREVFLVEEPIAAAIGAGVDITKPFGNLIVDIGAGTTDVAVISVGGVVVSASVKVAGDNFNHAIMNYVREKHWHTSIEIFAVMEGSLTFYLNEEEHPLKAGELMIINSNEVHSINSPEENHTAVLQIPLKQFEDYFTAHRFIRFAGSIPQMDTELSNLVQEMYRLYIKRGSGYEFKIRSFYYDVLYLLVNHYRLDEAGEQEVRHSRRLDALARITSYMREHYQEELKLTEIANMFANVNFKTYLQDIRMTYAYRELLNTDKTISQIALDNGFSSSRAFTREFQRRYGILPSELGRTK